MFAMQAANMRHVQIVQLPKRSHGGQTRNAFVVIGVDGPEQDEKTALFLFFYLTFV